MAEDLRSAAGPASDVLAPERGELLRVAASGDSVMWGQGVARADRFAQLITAELAARAGRPGQLVHDTARSGAPITAAPEELDDFADTFLHLFPGRPDGEPAITDGYDRPARRLFGEIPATCPTVDGQVRLLDPDLGRRIDVALLSGGANDLPFDNVVNPMDNSGRFMEVYEHRIQEVCYGKMLDLIRRVRFVMPNAVILVFGYQRAVSYNSSHSNIADYFQHEAHAGVFFILNGFAGQRDVDDAVLEAKQRGVWGHAQATYWLRRAVQDANVGEQFRGPGVLFVPARCRPGNAIYTPGSFVFSDYTDPTSDPMRAERLDQDPRMDMLNRIRNAWLAIQAPIDPPGSSRRQLLRQLGNDLNGPASLKKALAAWPGNRDVRELLEAEIHRLQRVQIASMFHPNAAGHRRYADTAVSRYLMHQQLLDDMTGRRELPPPQPGPGRGRTVEERLQRCGLRGTGPLAAVLGHYFIDSVQVWVTTAAESEQRFILDLFLGMIVQVDRRTATRMYPLSLQHRYPRGAMGRKLYPQLEPGRRDTFHIDTDGLITIDNLVGMSLVLGPAPEEPADERTGARVPRTPQRVLRGTQWRPSRVVVEFNGVQVVARRFDGQTFGPDSQIPLDFPETGPVLPDVFTDDT